MTTTKLSCDMTADCERPITHLDEKGYIYCTPHGESRRGGGIRCRKLRPYELRRLEAGQQVRSYA